MASLPEQKGSGVVILGVLLRLGLLLLYPADSALAVVELADSVQDQMIVQRGEPWVVSGTAGDHDKFVIEFLGKKIKVEPSSGKWIALFDVPSDYIGTAELKVDGHRLVKKIQVGDVWVCGGQSNMALNIEKAADGSQIAQDAAAKPVYILQVSKPITISQQHSGRWMAATLENTRKFSAVCLAFGASMSEQTKAPVGLIDASLGGTWIESWISAESFRKFSSASDSESRYEQRRALGKRGSVYDAEKPSQLFDLMIAPLTVKAIKGVLWYQGEGNRVNANSYSELLDLLIRDWRMHWRRPMLPFVIIQLPGFGDQKSDFDAKSRWALVRDTQRSVVSSAQRADLVVTVDLGDGTIHPGRKEPFGQRAADIAYALAYNQPEHSGILPTKVHIKGGSVFVEFSQGRACLKGNHQLPALVYVAGSNQRWFRAEVKVERSAIVAYSANVPSPVAIRYAWSDNPGIGLLSCLNNTPVTPFRSDDWPVFSHKNY